MTPSEFRMQILTKHARLGPSGQLSRCCHQRGTHPAGKVIFPTLSSAVLAAHELAERTEALRQDVYSCRHGQHFHLTKADGDTR